MKGAYLSKRYREKDGSIRLYAVINTWNPAKNEQDKKQRYIGKKAADGTYLEFPGLIYEHAGKETGYSTPAAL